MLKRWSILFFVLTISAVGLWGQMDSVTTRLVDVNGHGCAFAARDFPHANLHHQS